jgi:hypothetical protein
MTSKRYFLAIALAGFMLSTSTPMPSEATLLGITKAIERPAPSLEVARFARGGGARGGFARGGGYARGGFARRTTVVGQRGGVARSTTVRRGAVGVRGAGVARPGGRGGGVRWARPGRYWWPAGGAIAAGAAIGVVSAATAAAWVGAAPGPNMCWYYTDQSRTKGFWDVCQ